AETRFTAEGHVINAAADEPGRRKVRGVRRVSALPLACRRLGIVGIADLVEFRRDGEREIPFPIEIKRGKPKLHRADEVQLCAQALCLEEMTGTGVPDGALFYAETRRRLSVVFDHDLRELTESTIAALRETFATLVTPPPTPHKARCKSCSLHDICRPDAVARPAAAWRRRAIGHLLAAAEPPA
ncbi:MAG: CRISPR-associated protein Cas4, partial [Rhizobiales bacterium]|nr:CRISPR-associated protein Cas4 [Hyphomicrobiales bacterium]